MTDVRQGHLVMDALMEGSERYDYRGYMEVSLLRDADRCAHLTAVTREPTSEAKAWLYIVRLHRLPINHATVAIAHPSLDKILFFDPIGPPDLGQDVYYQRITECLQTIKAGSSVEFLDVYPQKVTEAARMHDLCHVHCLYFTMLHVWNPDASTQQVLHYIQSSVNMCEKITVVARVMQSMIDEILRRCSLNKLLALPDFFEERVKAACLRADFQEESAFQAFCANPFTMIPLVLESGPEVLEAIKKRVNEILTFYLLYKNQKMDKSDLPKVTDWSRGALIADKAFRDMVEEMYPGKMSATT